MELPETFQFNQGNLQDYADCRRRFQLRHIRRLSWPALQAEPALENEARLQQGARFHHLVRQHLLGVPEEDLTSSLSNDGALSRWWRNFLRFARQEGILETDGDLRLFPELALGAPLKSHRLVAAFDLVSLQPDGQATIYDWKTSRQVPPRTWLAGRLQTRVYPYLLVSAGDHLNGGARIAPSQAEMVYWFAEHPDQPVRFPYNEDQFQADSQYLESLAAQISALSPDEFHKTERVERCQYCVFRSLCERGVAAGQLGETGEEFDPQDASGFDLEFDQIAEIEF